MKLNSGISYLEGGLTASLRAMHVQSELIGVANENVGGFDKVGYQRKESIVSSFTEILGVHGLSTSIDDKVGRISMTENPLDLAIGTKGYFQTSSNDGIKLTRDGRFKIDKDGNLLTLEDAKVLADNGSTIKLPVLPEKLSDIVINSSGKVSVFNKKTNKLELAGTIGVVDTNGALVINPNVKQGYNEFSNVSLEREFLGMMPIVRNFEANRQIFMIQSQNLTKAISQLGSSS